MNKAIAVMGKWNPLCPAASIRELRGRAAGALALWLDQGRPLPLLCAEGRLRGQSMAGCLQAARQLYQLHLACAHAELPLEDNIYCWPRSNNTASEVEALQQMARQLGVNRLQLITSGYHVRRTRLIARQLGTGTTITVTSAEGAEIRAALTRLPAPSARALQQAIVQGIPRRAHRQLLASAELLSLATAFVPGLQRRLCDLARGSGQRGNAAGDGPSSEIFQPDASILQR